MYHAIAEWSRPYFTDFRMGHDKGNIAANSVRPAARSVQRRQILFQIDLEPELTIELRRAFRQKGIKNILKSWTVFGASCFSSQSNTDRKRSYQLQRHDVADARPVVAVVIMVPIDFAVREDVVPIVRVVPHGASCMSYVAVILKPYFDIDAFSSN